MIFETERLFIRHLEESDSESMFEIYSDKESMKYRANKPFTTISEAEALFPSTRIAKGISVSIGSRVVL